METESDAENTCNGGRTHRSHLASERIIMFQSSRSVKIWHDLKFPESQKS